AFSLYQNGTYNNLLIKDKNNHPTQLATYIQAAALYAVLYPENNVFDAAGSFLGGSESKLVRLDGSFGINYSTLYRECKGFEDEIIIRTAAFIADCTARGMKLNSVNDAAAWKENIYLDNYIHIFHKATVVFDKNCDDAVSTFKKQTLWCGNSDNKFTGDISRTGYTFKGWALQADAKTADYQKNAKVKDSWIERVYNNDNLYKNDTIVLYAVWEKNNSALVIFDANGGKNNTFGSQEFIPGKKGQKFTGSVTRGGYELVGWSLDPKAATPRYKPNSGVSDSFIESVMTKYKGTVRLYAVWERSNHAMVIFDANGGTDNTFGSQIFVFGKEGQKFTGTVARTGYVFTGWSRDPEAETPRYKPNSGVSDSFIESVITKYEGTVTLYAVWQKNNSALVIFDANGGKNNTFGSQEFVPGKKGQKFTGSVTRNGYILAGWSLDPKAATPRYKPYSGVSDSFIETVMSKRKGVVTLYAVWEPAKVTVTFDGNGADTNTFTQQTFTCGKSGQYFHGKISRTGYDFSGWSFSKTDTAGRYKVNSNVTDTWIYTNAVNAYNGNVTLYAIWKPKTCTVIFNGQGADINIFGSQVFVYGKNGQRFEGIIQKDGYRFLGWSLTPDGEPKYLLNNKVKDYFINNVATKACWKGTINLYAIWEEIETEPETETATDEISSEDVTEETVPSETVDDENTGIQETPDEPMNDESEASSEEDEDSESSGEERSPETDSAETGTDSSPSEQPESEPSQEPEAELFS
ncbi:MAG: InlB B-repeat-containing protein, partial [Parasporobacterium sp.]|nr:InlB B-repeat-containing protein [Parasporobacterium sp.]